MISLTVMSAQAAATEPERATAEEPVIQPVTLDALLQEALEKNPGLQAKRRAYEASQARAIAAWLPDDPQIGVDVEGQSSLFRFDRADNEYMVMQTIPFPVKLWLRGWAASREAEMAFQQYREAQRSVLWHIEQPYYEFALAQKTRAALEQSRALLDRLAAAVQTRYEYNQASQQDILKVRIESSKLGIDIFQWREKEHLSQAHFSHILNRPLESVYHLADVPRRAALSFARSELEAMALRIRPELKALELGIKRAKTNRALAATNWLPDLTGRLEARQFAGEGRLREYDTFLGVTVPVWSLIKGVGGEWKGAQREVQAAEAAYAEMKNEVRLSIHEAYSKVQVADQGLTTYERVILPQAQQQVEVALASYEAGRADMLALIDAQRMLKDAQIAQAKFAADYELGLSDLRLAVGNNLQTQ